MIAQNTIEQIVVRDYGCIFIHRTNFGNIKYSILGK